MAEAGKRRRARPWDPARPDAPVPSAIIVDTDFQYPSRSDKVARGRRRVRIWHDKKEPFAMFARFDRRRDPSGRYNTRSRHWTGLSAEDVVAWLAVWRRKGHITDVQYAEALSAVGEAAATKAYQRGLKKYRKEVRMA